MSKMENSGLWAAAGAYLLWGFLPIYWKIIKHVPSFEILCHRIAWSFVFVGILLVIRRRNEWIAEVRKSPKILLHFTASSLLLAANWFIYIWGVNSNYIVETSLGYFINPLVNVLIGVVLLNEKLRGIQWTAVGLAAIGVTYLTVVYGAFPWISLSLAFSFAFYGYLRKTGALGSLEGLSLETAVLVVPASAYLIFLQVQGKAVFLEADWLTHGMLILSGAVTSVPLILFAYGAKRVTMSTLGILQYFAPTIQFSIGVFMYNEPFDTTRLVGFVFIWTALLLYTIDRFYQLSRYKKPV